MGNITSVNIKKCEIATSEKHNKRSADYLANIHKEKFYLRSDLMHLNEEWVSPDIVGQGLKEHLDYILAKYQEKHKQPMNMKDVTYTNKKGKVVTRAGASPIREGVVVINENTTMEQLKDFCQRCQQEFGITALQIFIHRDEGHNEYDEERNEWKPNLHAHIVWDWMNHATWKTQKCNEDDMSRMQTILAECLNMERGKSKEETQREHLERNEFIIAKLEHKAATAKKELDDAVSRRDEAIETTTALVRQQLQLETENVARQEQVTLLDEEIATKRKKAEKADKVVMGAIKEGIANVLGFGKFQETARENEKLKATQAEREAVLKKQYESEALLAIEKEKDKHASKYNILVDKYNQLLRRNKEVIGIARELNAMLDDERIAHKKSVEWKDALLELFAERMMRIYEQFKQAIRIIIDFAKSKFNLFDGKEAGIIRNTIDQLADTPKDRENIAIWLIDIAKNENGEPFSKERHRQTLNEVMDIANGNYDVRIERNGRGASK